MKKKLSKNGKLLNMRPKIKSRLHILWLNFLIYCKNFSVKINYFLEKCMELNPSRRNNQYFKVLFIVPKRVKKKIEKCSISILCFNKLFKIYR